MNIPFTISGLRKKGLTQSQIGEALGLKQPTISGIETGKCGVKNPTFALVSGLTRLAAQYGVDTEPTESAAQVVDESIRRTAEPKSIAQEFTS